MQKAKSEYISPLNSTCLILYWATSLLAKRYFGKSSFRSVTNDFQTCQRKKEPVEEEARVSRSADARMISL